MALSTELLSQIVKVTNDKTETKNQTLVNGTIKQYGDTTYVMLDGSDLLTPVESTTSTVKHGDRVTVVIKDHRVSITGNTTDPSASSGKVKVIDGQVQKLDSITAYKVTAEELEVTDAEIVNLEATLATIDKLTVVSAELEALKAIYAELDYADIDTLNALNASIENLEAKIGTFDDLTTEELEAVTAHITNLKGYNANFTYVIADEIHALKGEFKSLDAKYANLDFANIGEAAIKEFFAKSGMIDNLTMQDGTVTGELVGVTISGDLILANTLRADRLLLKGNDGLYYALNTNGVQVNTDGIPQTAENSLDGRVILAKSIVADQISVSDLEAFGARIANFIITKNSLYSGVKDGIENTTRGIYMDDDGQIVFGDADNYIKFHKVLQSEETEESETIDEGIDNPYKLEIIADSLLLGNGQRNIEDELDNIEVGGRNLIRNSTNLIFTEYEFIEVDRLVDENGLILLDETGNEILNGYDDSIVI